MKRSMVLAGLSLFLLTACGTASVVTEEGAEQSSSSVAPTEQVPAEGDAQSSVSSVVAVDADAAVDGSVVAE